MKILRPKVIGSHDRIGGFLSILLNDMSYQIILHVTYIFIKTDSNVMLNYCFPTSGLVATLNVTKPKKNHQLLFFDLAPVASLVTNDSA
ncbi:hypothetical protein DVH24_036584 [Malus domestica]|uniref:Uncharacterized protein n=1 Tax=Malus domestica TaxID=3750 RepID=A0A498ILZ0_MALDO|nr:hypothetical protein DVH24_036584 [Malus domestica]